MLVSIAALCACTSSRTQTIALFDAEPALRERAARVALVVRDADGAVRFDGALEAAASGLVARVPMEPEGGDATRRWAITAALEDGTGSVLATLTAAGGYVAGERRYARLVFREAACGACDAGTRCDGAECVSLCVDTTRSEAELAPPIACPSDRDAGPRDGGGIDGGSDAGPDAGSDDAGTPDAPDTGTDAGCVGYAERVAAEPGLVLWHRMEEADGPTATDSSPAGLHGTYESTGAAGELVFSVPGPGGTGSAVEMRRLDDSNGAGISLNPRLSGGTSFVWFEGDPYTIEAWIYDEAGWGDGAGSPIVIAERYLERGFRLKVDHVRREVAFQPWGSEQDVVATLLGAGRWAHVVVTVEPMAGSSRVEIFVDGVSGAASTYDFAGLDECTPGDCEASAHVGSGQGDSADLRLDEVAIYRGVLPASTIAEHAAAGRVACP